jgi:hypothetical protein
MRAGEDLGIRPAEVRTIEFLGEHELAAQKMLHTVETTVVTCRPGGPRQVVDAWEFGVHGSCLHWVPLLLLLAQEDEIEGCVC